VYFVWWNCCGSAVFFARWPRTIPPNKNYHTTLPEQLHQVKATTLPEQLHQAKKHNTAGTIPPSKKHHTAGTIPPS
jgi:hypothetical protein